MENNIKQTATPEINATPMLVMAILSIAFSGTYVLSFAGIVLAIIATKKTEKLAAQYGELTGMAKAANILARVGTVLSIIVAVLGTILVFMSVFIYLGEQQMGDNYYYYSSGGFMLP